MADRFRRLLLGTAARLYAGEKRRSEGALRPLRAQTLDGTPLRAAHRTHVRVVIKGDGSRAGSRTLSRWASGGLVYGTLPRALFTGPPSFFLSCRVTSTPAAAFACCRSWAWMCARTRASPSLSCGAEFPFPFPSPYLCRVGTALPWKSFNQNIATTVFWSQSICIAFRAFTLSYFFPQNWPVVGLAGFRCIICQQTYVLLSPYVRQFHISVIIFDFRSRRTKRLEAH